MHNGDAKIADFGFAKNYIMEKTNFSSARGTVSTMAP